MENGEIRRYLHLGTGNYHDGTAKLYTDMGLFTADPALGEDTAKFFYELESESPVFVTSVLIKAPEQMKECLLRLIGREKENALCGRPSGIIAKMNSLLDTQIIEALYAASCAGVPVELIVRGVCALIPGIANMSDNIRVTSIVGRHLEHARAFRFVNGGEPEVYLSSADWMSRNLEKRVELMFPVKSEDCRRAVENVLQLQLKDNQKGWLMLSDGSYLRKTTDAEMPVNAQEMLLADVEGIFSLRDTTPHPTTFQPENPDGKAVHI